MNKLPNTELISITLTVPIGFGLAACWPVATELPTVDIERAGYSTVYHAVCQRTGEITLQVRILQGWLCHQRSVKGHRMLELNLG